MRRTMRCIALGLILVPSVAFSSNNYVLTFDAANCVNPPACAGVNGYGPFSQNYGDVASVVDVSHRAVSNWGNASQVDAAINYYGSGYGALNAVAWAGTDQNNTNHLPQFGEITLRSLAGNGMTLNKLDTAGWGGATMNVTFRIYDLSYVLLYSATVVAPGTGALSVDFGGVSNSGGLILQWGSDSFNTGIDNLSFTVGPVETMTYKYDAKGRLVKVVRAGTVNNNVTYDYLHDKANNRKSVKVSNSPNPPPP